MSEDAERKARAAQRDEGVRPYAAVERASRNAAIDVLRRRYEPFPAVVNSVGDTVRRPLLLGTPEEDKIWTPYPGTHSAPLNDLIRDALDFLDNHLGPVGQ